MVFQGRVGACGETLEGAIQGSKGKGKMDICASTVVLLLWM